MLWHRSSRLAAFPLVATTIVLSSTGFLVLPCRGLHICILCGSTRTNGPPRPILSDRVAKYMETCLTEQRVMATTTTSLKDNPAIANDDDDDDTRIMGEKQRHEVTVIKARDFPILMERPHFTYPKSQVPKELDAIHNALQRADAYVVCTPEYNHSPCPGLLNLMNHFGSSTFAFKPSGIVSYSAGQWGGTRAAHSLRPFLSELGCLPVSAMVHIPLAGKVFDSDGQITSDEDEERWLAYSHRMLSQLEWWAEAAKQKRIDDDPFLSSPAFDKNPSERNAPS